LTTVAIPVFRRRIAPVFDSCLRVLLIHIEHDHCIQRRRLYVYGLCLSERVDVLQMAGATTIICAGISDVLDNMLENAGIRVIEGNAGQIDDVLRAFISIRPRAGDATTMASSTGRRSGYCRTYRAPGTIPFWTKWHRGCHRCSQAIPRRVGTPIS
jgi:predicted Fe-Mo cluster-binding NifX family protein